jgi:NhaP-type Na+/H+ or K+/H+ antiporter
MHHDLGPLLTIGWAVAAGVLAQALAHAWRVPAIVLLLAFGVLMGPEALGLVHPDALGGGLGVIVKLAVAVILFEGAFALRLRDLRQSAGAVRGLVTVGVVISWGLATLVTHYVAGLDWPLAILFGALMTVTGPTVVQPLMRRLSVTRRVKTVLEGEAILVDPIGALLAVAVFDVVLGLIEGAAPGPFGALWHYVGRLVIGGIIGLAGGVGLALVLRARRLVPRELMGLVALGFVWLTFALAEAGESEAGIMAAVVMGLAFQRAAPPHARTLRHFKEQLTTLGVSLLFVLLAAGLQLETLWAERGGGFLAVLLLVFAVRPIAVLLSTRATGLSLREQLFVSWIGQRGIVAASVASLFALALAERGLSGGERVLALTFLTILFTVTVQGLTAPLAARALRVGSMERSAVLIVGAGSFGRAVARVIEGLGRSVVLIDRNEALVEQAWAEGHEAHAGNALEEAFLERAGAGDAETLLALTSNAEVNALAVQLAHEEFGVARAYPALTGPERGASTGLLARTGGHLAFGRPLDVRAWDHVLASQSRPFTWTVPAGFRATRADAVEVPEGVLPVVRLRRGSPEVVHAGQAWEAGDEVLGLTTLDPDATQAAFAETEGA